MPTSSGCLWTKSRACIAHGVAIDCSEERHRAHRTVRHMWLALQGTDARACAASVADLLDSGHDILGLHNGGCRRQQVSLVSTGAWTSRRLRAAHAPSSSSLAYAVGTSCDERRMTSWSSSSSRFSEIQEDTEAPMPPLRMHSSTMMTRCVFFTDIYAARRGASARCCLHVAASSRRAP